MFTTQQKLQDIGDKQLLERLGDLVNEDNRLTVEMLIHLAEVETRKLYLEHPHSSMFAYCVAELGFSEDVTNNRLRAARAAVKFPMILGMLERGELHLTGVRLLAPYLSSTNHGELLGQAVGMSRREIERLIAEWFPKPDVPALVRKVPVRRGPVRKGAAAVASVVVGPAVLLDAQSAPALPALAVDGAERELLSGALEARQPSRRSGTSEAQRSSVKPSAADRFIVRFTVDEEFHKDLEQAKELLSHKLAPDDLPALFGEALKLLVAKTKAERFGVGRKPRKTQGASAPTSAISTSVKRAVYERDEGRCTYLGKTGRRCDERSLLQFDHIIARARGGLGTVENIRILCASHNLRAAEVEFGDEVVSTAIARARGRRRSVAALPAESAVSSAPPGANSRQRDFCF